MFPFESDSFDVVLFCEVIEHLLMDPVVALREIKRVLRPGGSLVVSTPNVARLENMARLAAGANLYDPYSGYGPYGRHNREYTRHELVKLLEFVGFQPDIHFTADVHPHNTAAYVDVSCLLPYWRTGWQTLVSICSATPRTWAEIEVVILRNCSARWPRNLD